MHSNFFSSFLLHSLSMDERFFSTLVMSYILAAHQCMHYWCTLLCTRDGIPFHLRHFWDSHLGQRLLGRSRQTPIAGETLRLILARPCLQSRGSLSEIDCRELCDTIFSITFLLNPQHTVKPCFHCHMALYFFAAKVCLAAFRH